MKKSILVVDDEEMIRNLLATALEGDGYACRTAANADEAFTVMENENFDLVISDIMMPGRSGVDLLKDLKAADSDLAVLMITGLSDMNTAMDCIHLGADDYITKPFSINRVILTVKNLLEKRHLALERKNYQISLESKVLEQTEQIRRAMKELHDAYHTTLTALVKSLDAREKEVGSHSERVMNYTVMMGVELGISGNELEQMAKGALLHDIGKIGISDNILLKPGKLDDAEWLEMRKHPQIGYNILTDIPFLKEPAEIIYNHHERFDGNGYPNRKAGEDIPLGARIFSLVDTLDAMTSDRPYRKALPFDAVIDEVRKCSGNQFDPQLAELFLSISRKRWEECAGKSFL